MLDGVSPVLWILLILVGMANLIPCAIYLVYQRRLYQKLKRRRNSDEFEHDIKTPPEMVEDEHEHQDEEIGVPKVIVAEEEKPSEEAAKAFVTQQEQLLTARWNTSTSTRGKGYNVLTNASPQAS